MTEQSPAYQPSEPSRQDRVDQAVREGFDEQYLDPAPARRVVICPTRTPEPHHLGEFPMTCYRCHIEADS